MSKTGVEGYVCVVFRLHSQRLQHQLSRMKFTMHNVPRRKPMQGERYVFGQIGYRNTDLFFVIVQGRSAARIGKDGEAQ